MTVAVIIGIVALICLTAMGVCVTVLSRQSVSDAFRALERIESRHKTEMQTVLDRLMTIKWEDYIVARSAEDADEGGFITPEEQKDQPVEVDDGRWGHLSTLRDRLDLLDNERDLIDEDFDEEGSPRRASE